MSFPPNKPLADYTQDELNAETKRIRARTMKYGMDLCDAKLEHQMQHGYGELSAEEVRGIVADTEKRIRSPGPYKCGLVKPQNGCVNCGNGTAHMHGKHACCGRQGCHMKIYTEHWAYGEKRVSRHMKENWPSLRGLKR